MFEATSEVRSYSLALSQAAETRLEGVDQAGLITLLRDLEDLKSAAAALQARATADLFELRSAAEEAHGVRADKRGAGLASEVALARRESPNKGSRFLGLAMALTRELPRTFAALAQGDLSEWRASLIVRETACISVEDRAFIDHQLRADSGGVQGWGDRQLIAQTQRMVYELDPQAFVIRRRKAVADRHVSVRPAPDTMVRLSALLPVAQGVACYAALNEAAKAAQAQGDARGRGQVMADTLIERLTGRDAAASVDVEVKVVMTDRALFATDAEPAHLEGYGTVPAQWARDLARGAVGEVAAWFRQFYTHPATGQLVAMSSRQRTAPAGLAEFIATRDQTCRTPWCDAPIRHTDHIWNASDDGQTQAENLQGLCEACNYAKASPGWRARGSAAMRHLVVTQTPTGHTYRSTAPPLPGRSHADGEFYYLAG